MKGRPDRTRAREIALTGLYLIDLRKGGDADVLDEALDPDGEFADTPAAVVEDARGLVRGVLERGQQIDAALGEAAENWRLDRMAAIDRNVLRLGVYEILHREDVPPKVAIDEAIELAKKYGTEGSGAFVNGVLDRIHKQTSPDGQG